jgi:hypothetical protein
LSSQETDTHPRNPNPDPLRGNPSTLPESQPLSRPQRQPEPNRNPTHRNRPRASHSKTTSRGKPTGRPPKRPASRMGLLPSSHRPGTARSARLKKEPPQDRPPLGVPHPLGRDGGL